LPTEYTAGKVIDLSPDKDSGRPDRPSRSPAAGEGKAALGVELTSGPNLDSPERRVGRPKEFKASGEEPALSPQGPGAQGPVVRLVNKRRITLNYEIKGVGPSGVSGVELWYTRDTKDWRKHDSPPEARPPYIIEVQEEGLYGFTLLARNGIGLGKEPPHGGDLPQVWVEVDLTKPVVAVTDAQPGYNNHAPTLAIHWKASDKNLGGQPICLSYAERQDGPWEPIATNIENSGRYLWALRPGLPARLYLRVEARDLAGNVGVAQSSGPVTIDLARPTVTILDVEAGNR
jgi:hypothetical protein